MASASSLAQFNSSDSGEKGFETIEIDPQYALGLGLKQNDLVCVKKLRLNSALTPE
jgi:peroxin-1